MKGRISLLACLSVTASATGIAQEKPGVPVYDVAQIDQIRAAQGQVVRVRGLVERTGKSRGSGMNFLNFPGGEFTAVVFAKSLKNFPDGEPADVLEGKWVEISGEVRFYKDQPQIEVETPGQIVLLDPATKKPLPPPAPAAAPAADGPDPDKPEPAPGPEPPADAGKVDPRLYFDDP